MVDAKINTQRWMGTATILIIIMIGFLDRMNVSVLITDKEFLQHFGIEGNRVAQGQLMSLFLMAYGVSAFFLSSLYETFLGVRKGFLISIVIWALFTLISPLAGGLFILLAFRFVLGAAEGPLFSLKTMYINEWFAAGERGKPNALASIGSSLGLAMGIPLTTYLVYSFNWHVSFYSIGFLNLLVGLPLVWFCLSKEHGPVYVKQQEKTFSEKRCETAQQESSGLRRLVDTFELALTTPGLMWMILIQICHQSYLWGTSSWLPSYLLQEKGFSLKAMGVLASLPFVVSLSAGLLGGYIVDRMPRNRMPMIFVFGGIATSLTLVAAVTAKTPIVTAALMIVAQGFWGIQGPTIPTTLQLTADQRSVGSAYGIMNGIGNLVSSFIPAMMGALIGIFGGFSAGFSLIIGAEALVVLCGIRLLFHAKIKATYKTVVKTSSSGV